MADAGLLLVLRTSCDTQAARPATASLFHGMSCTRIRRQKRSITLNLGACTDSRRPYIHTGRQRSHCRHDPIVEVRNLIISCATPPAGVCSCGLCCSQCTDTRYSVRPGRVLSNAACRPCGSAGGPVECVDDRMTVYSTVVPRKSFDKLLNMLKYRLNCRTMVGHMSCADVTFMGVADRRWRTPTTMVSAGLIQISLLHNGHQHWSFRACRPGLSSTLLGRIRKMWLCVCLPASRVSPHEYADSYSSVLHRWALFLGESKPPTLSQNSRHEPCNTVHEGGFAQPT